MCLFQDVHACKIQDVVTDASINGQVTDDRDLVDGVSQELSDPPKLVAY